MPASDLGPRRIIITPTAERDLDQIWFYLVTRSSIDIAENVLSKIKDEISKLAFMPGMGHRRPDITDSRYRVSSVYSYLIVYRFTSKTLTVSRVVSGYRDLRRIFRKRR